MFLICVSLGIKKEYRSTLHNSYLIYFLQLVLVKKYKYNRIAILQF